MALLRAARPAAGPRRRVRERQESHVMTAPGGANKHRHCTTIDTEGNGCTDAGVDGHVHQVVALEVMPAGPDQHGHGMSAQRCTADHERGRCSR